MVSPFWSSKNGTNRSSKRGYRYNVSHHKETGETRCTGTSGKIREVPVQRVSPGSFPWMIFYTTSVTIENDQVLNGKSSLSKVNGSKRDPKRDQIDGLIARF